MARIHALLLLVFMSGPVMAATHWLCGLSGDLTRLVCVADNDPLDPAVAHAAPAPHSANVNGTRFPLDSRRPYTVELWSPPDEAVRVELLARSTICYRSPGCQVTLILPAYLLATKH